MGGCLRQATLGLVGKVAGWTPPPTFSPLLKGDGRMATDGKAVWLSEAETWKFDDGKGESIDAGSDFSRRDSSQFSESLANPEVLTRSRKRRAGSIQSRVAHQPVSIK